ncbi:MAG: heme-copper oxidase subunit III [Dehalococcoidia bacterium]|nr:heme-copper oxidase subunit III [Dehalococcoidia bacterium]
MTTHAATAQAAHLGEQGMSRGMFGMVLFIASEIMLFGGLFAGYFYMRNQAASWPPEGVHEVDPVTGGILTAILVISGLSAHMGVVGAKAGNQGLFIFGLAGALLLGTIFIGGQIYEWFLLMDHGLTAESGVYGSSFYVLTGFHGAHVIVGLAMLLVVFIRGFWRDFTPKRHLFVDASVLYWHFVDIVWVFLYAALYVLV